MTYLRIWAEHSYNISVDIIKTCTGDRVELPIVCLLKHPDLVKNIADMASAHGGDILHAYNSQTWLDLDDGVFYFIKRNY